MASLALVAVLLVQLTYRTGLMKVPPVEAVVSPDATPIVSEAENLKGDEASGNTSSVVDGVDTHHISGLKSAQSEVPFTGAESEMVEVEGSTGVTISEYIPFPTPCTSFCAGGCRCENCISGPPMCKCCASDCC